MALSPSAAREPLHTRRVECRGFVREDGLFDVEAELIDDKTYAFDNHWRGRVEPGDPVHHMRVRLTVDERLEIRVAEAETLRSPFAICPDATANVARLVGLRIRPGWMREVKALYGRDQGCTHILELMYPIGTTVFQTIFPWRERKMRESGASEAEALRKGPPLDSCWAYSREREVVKRLWPEEYTGPEGDPVA